MKNNFRYRKDTPLRGEPAHVFPRRSQQVFEMARRSAWHFMRSALAFALMACLMMPSGLYAQESSGEYRQLSFEQLDQLVAPIALYPDALVAQILTASTYVPQVVEAARFVSNNDYLPPQKLAQRVNMQPWDPSVKALTAFPSVLANLDRNLSWTTRLGDAYYNQPQDVMAAVQTMRNRAYEVGTLRSTPEQAVIYRPGDIVIEPVSPAVVYVPAYDPWIVYGAPVPVYPAYYYVAPPPRPAGHIAVAAAIGFTAGVVVGAFAHYGWGWEHWNCGWGPHPVVAYNHVTYVSRSVTVVNHGYYGRYNHSVTAYGPHGGAYADQRSMAGGQYTNSRSATGPHGASYSDQRTIGNGQYANDRTITRANGSTYTDQRFSSNGQSTNTRSYTGAGGRTATSTTTRYPGGSSTTVTGPNGRTASRTVTGRGTGHATVTKTGRRGRTRTHTRHRYY